MVCRVKVKILVMLLMVCTVGGVQASTVTVIDKLGRRVELEVPVKRAVIVISYELIPALNLWNQVVGVSRWAQENCGLYRALIAENPSLERPVVGVGTNVNIEAVMKLDPDVVITWTYNPDVIGFLEQRGINVIGIYPESLEELYRDMRMHGKIFGREGRTEEVIREMNKLFKLISERTSRIPYEKRKVVIHLAGAPTRVSGGLGVINDVIRTVGAINAAGKIMQKNIDVSVERIIEWNPDVIFIWGSAGYDESWLYGNSQWRFIKAVRDRQVHKLPRWSTWSPRLAPIALYMAMRVYPECFADVDFEKRVDEFYKKVFGLSYYEVKKYEEP
ncbi:ABC transporter substrate-binding protein [Thermodesulforhabdus norvegica]|uniref:Iron complex transport system substrate-binding protein n=1 Tax=Thermodesulforhabdus norvegica TaxID=39841 RepID=A0A1I4RMH6_9BACT|nr:ABC transporter substrate-binding protein [Thermodesulforhabdus norvegica]SFM53448.1 iron complex transport system substrate-binding protein [Thermodesulforhabdus norvegica]